MKLFQYAATLLFVSLLACQKPSDAIKPGDSAKPDSTVTATPTPIGQPIGAPTTKTIGPAGGTLVSSDGKITLDIPAGAVRKETVITLQPTENTAPNGVGTSFKLSPAGLTFDQPVIVSYTFQDEEMNGVSIDAMGLAFQDDQRGWQQTRSFKIDKTTKTAKIKLSNTDLWSMISQYTLTPQQAVVVTGETKELILTRVGKIEFSDGIDAASLVPEDARSSIDKLSINGADWTGTVGKDPQWGSVSLNKNSLQLLYVAPNKKPQTRNPVEVGVELKNTGVSAKIIIYSIIKIENENSLSINNRTFDNLSISALFVKGQLLVDVAGADSTGKRGLFSLALAGLAVGAHPFTPATVSPEQATYIVALNEAGKTDATISGTSSYHNCSNEKTEGGTVHVVSVEPANLGYTKVVLNVSGSVATIHYVDEHCNVTEHKTMPVSARLTVLFRQ